MGNRWCRGAVSCGAIVCIAVLFTLWCVATLVEQGRTRRWGETSPNKRRPVHTNPQRSAPKFERLPWNLPGKPTYQELKGRLALNDITFADSLETLLEKSSNPGQHKPRPLRADLAHYPDVGEILMTTFRPAKTYHCDGGATMLRLEGHELSANGELLCKSGRNKGDLRAELGREAYRYTFIEEKPTDGGGIETRLREHFFYPGSDVLLTVSRQYDLYSFVMDAPQRRTQPTLRPRHPISVGGVELGLEAAQVMERLGSPTRQTATIWEYPTLRIAFEEGRVSALAGETLAQGQTVLLRARQSRRHIDEILAINSRIDSYWGGDARYIYTDDSGEYTILAPQEWVEQITATAHGAESLRLESR